MAYQKYMVWRNGVNKDCRTLREVEETRDYVKNEKSSGKEYRKGLWRLHRKAHEPR